MINILILLIVLFYLNIINIKILKKYPVILLFLILNIIVIKNNKKIGLILFLFLIVLIVNLKKKIKGGALANTIMKGIMPSLGLVEKFQDYVVANKTNNDNVDNLNVNSQAPPKVYEPESRISEPERKPEYKQNPENSENSENSEDSEEDEEDEDDDYDGGKTFKPDTSSKNDSMNIFNLTGLFGGDDDDDDDDDELVENFVL